MSAQVINEIGVHVKNDKGGSAEQRCPNQKETQSLIRTTKLNA